MDKLNNVSVSRAPCLLLHSPSGIMSHETFNGSVSSQAHQTVLIPINLSGKDERNMSFVNARPTAQLLNSKSLN